MSILAKKTSRLVVKTVNTRVVSLALSFVLIVLAVSQLFSFDGFLMAMVNYHLGPVPAAYLMGALLLGGELLALPYLLNLRLSRAFRWFSWALGWLVLLGWFWLSGVAIAIDVANIGFLGSLAALVSGWWAVLISLAFIILMAWVSWGMWPGGAARKK